MLFLRVRRGIERLVSLDNELGKNQLEALRKT